MISDAILAGGGVEGGGGSGVNTAEIISNILDRPLLLGGHVESQENKRFVFARQASARREFSARLAVQKQSFLFS